MPSKTLTDSMIRKLPAGTYTDAGCKIVGATLQLRVSPQGKRTFDLLYRNEAGKRCRVGSRKFPHRGEFGASKLTVAGARKAAQEAWRQVWGEGRDFVAERKAERQNGTVRDIAEAYCISLMATGESPSIKNAVARIRFIMRTDPIADIPALRLTHEEVTAFLDRRQEQAASRINGKDGRGSREAAQRALVAMFNRAGISPNPASPQVSPHRTKAAKLAKIKEAETKKLTPDELAGRVTALWTEAHGKNYAQVARDLFLFLMLTGKRKSEVMHCQWSQIDLEKRLWRIPPEQPGNKAARLDLVPLTDACMEMLKRRHADRDANCEFVFPSRNKPMEPVSYTYLNCTVSWATRYGRPAVAERHGIEMTVHDIRRLAASWCGMNPRFMWAPPFILNHASKSGDAVDALYVIGDPIEPLREAMQAFENWVREQAEGQPSNVVKMERA